MKINTLADLRKLVSQLERYDDNMKLGINTDGQAKNFSVNALPFAPTLWDKPNFISLVINTGEHIVPEKQTFKGNKTFEVMK